MEHLSKIETQWKLILRIGMRNLGIFGTKCEERRLEESETYMVF